MNRNHVVTVKTDRTEMMCCCQTVGMAIFAMNMVFFSYA